MDYKAYRTFSVVPASKVSDEAISISEVVERQLLFFLRNELESVGFRFVELDQKPDFLATLSMSSDHQSWYVPPETTTRLVYVPEQEVRTSGTISGTFNYNSYGTYSSHGWGTYSGTTSSTTYIPAHLASRSHTIAGYTIDHYYPFAKVQMFDGKTMGRIWVGSGSGRSDNPDMRVSGQLVVADILGRFPKPEVTLEGPSGAVGVDFEVLTIDGEAYVPTVVNLADGGPAIRAGLSLEDMILSIDGEGVVNKTFADISELMAGEPGTVMRLEVWRGGRVRNFSLSREPREKVWGQQSK